MRLWFVVFDIVNYRGQEVSYISGNNRIGENLFLKLDNFLLFTDYLFLFQDNPVLVINPYSQKENDDYVNTIRSIIPKPQNVPLEERRNNTMSTLSIDNINFVGIIEIPRYGSSLPVCADWGDITSFPCKLSPLGLS